MDWFLYDNGLRLERVNSLMATVSLHISVTINNLIKGASRLGIISKFHF